MTAIRIVITGRVQGVGYRAWAVAMASSLGLKGWVRNRSDGTVEALFHGEETVIEAMIDACKEGPPAARVDKIVSYECEEEINERFTARPTV